MGGLVLLLAALDFKYYFHQLFFAASEAWKMGALLPIVQEDGTIALQWALDNGVENELNSFVLEG